MDGEKSKTFAKKFLTFVMIVFITLVVLFVIVFSWLLIKNPLNVRGIILFNLGWIDTPVQITPLEKNVEENVSPGDEGQDSGVQTNIPDQAKDVLVPPATAVPMTSDQRKAVEAFGINPDSVVITPAMEDCFVEKLGQQRVDEIVTGDVPGAFELFKASSCL